MGLDDRLLYLLLGMAIGFILGRLTRTLNHLESEVEEIKEELDEVDEMIKEDSRQRKKDESGFMRHPIVRDIAVLLVVALSFWASIVSQKSSNDVTDSQDRLDTLTRCLFISQGAALDALNERSTYTKATADANIDLQRSQARFFGVLLHQPPYSESRQTDAVQQYYLDLQAFLDIAAKGATKVAENPFPTVDDLQKCLTDQE